MSIKLVISSKPVAGLSGFDVGQQVSADFSSVVVALPVDGELVNIDLNEGSKEVEVIDKIEVEPAVVNEKGKVTKKAVLKEEKRTEFQQDPDVVKRESERVQDNPLIGVIDPGFVDPEQFGPPVALGVVRFASLPAPGTSSTYDKMKALGVSDEAILAGIQIHNPASYPELEVTVL